MTADDEEEDAEERNQDQLEEDEEDAEDEEECDDSDDSTRGRARPSKSEVAVGDQLGSEEEDEDEDEIVRIVGMKRKTLHDKYDPKKARKRKLRDYYGKGSHALVFLYLRFLFSFLLCRELLLDSDSGHADYLGQKSEQSVH